MKAEIESKVVTEIVVRFSKEEFEALQHPVTIGNPIVLNIVTELRKLKDELERRAKS